MPIFNYVRVSNLLLYMTALCYVRFIIAIQAHCRDPKIFISNIFAHIFYSDVPGSHLGFEAMILYTDLD